MKDEITLNEYTWVEKTCYENTWYKMKSVEKQDKSK